MRCCIIPMAAHRPTGLRRTGTTPAFGLARAVKFWGVKSAVRLDTGAPTGGFQPHGLSSALCPVGWTDWTGCPRTVHGPLLEVRLLGVRH
jgi:hypothetical protein